MAPESKFPEDTYVLALLPHRPPWPGIVCSPRDVPKEYHSRRPSRFVEDRPVLLLHKMDIEWVPLTDLEGMPGWDCPEELGKLYPGLQLAYDAVKDGYRDETGAKGWLNILETRNELNGFQPSKPRPTCDSEYGSDLKITYEDLQDLEKAIQASLEDMREGKRSGSPATNHSYENAPKRQRNSYNISSQITKSKNAALGDKLPTPPRSSPSSPSKNGTIRGPAASNRPSGRESTSASPLKPLKNPNHQSAKKESDPLTIEQILARERAEEAGPAEDLDLDVANSNDFVEFRIGEDDESFFIPYRQVHNRPYFSAKNLGLLVPKKDGGWLIDRAYLRTISAVDFRLIAQFLENDTFGITYIETEEQRQESLTECVAAWSIAQELIMDDLMDLIVQKLQSMLRLELEEVLAFASQVYREADDGLEPRRDMKGFLVGRLAEGFWELVREHQTNFLGRLRMFPELELDVFRRRVGVLEGVISEGGEGGGDDEDEDEDG
ncbi:hypothetical protein P154DRAFT_179983 [Amniculicola lignicola CBS 123094]|uniref:PWWP domain-containing protein n=1 Tax=Amniculicola lignicola CBS 123094 TaxID=1392246 RepID=A0A6A5X2Y6_9PLEO|nr:hypothetical protein P154DRAFT_179983 [Amniculicola lignicola CBS 123094]